MKKVRVYELAKDLNLESKVLVDFLLDLGAEIKNHMSTVEDDIAKMVKEHFLPDDDAELDETSIPGKDKDLMSADKGRVKKGKMQTGSREDDARNKPDKKGRRGNAQGRRRPGRRQERVEERPSVKVTEMSIPDAITVRDLASRLGVPVVALIKKLMSIGVMSSAAQSVEFEVAQTICQQYGVKVKPIKDLAEIVFAEVEAEDEDKMQPRPPVVTIMGHVDHGKTTLLDGIRKSRVTETEAGGITQHIGAYQVNYRDRKITFLDTPGHAAFTAMRSRGAQATDMAILVVAADDGVMPQTVEALNHAKAAKVPIVVAINKMDRAGANPDRVKQELTEYQLVPEEWGGDTIFVPISALKLEGIDDLLEMILLVADMEEFKANPDGSARGTVIEAKLDKGRGPVATVLISTGTLRVGDSFVVGNEHGRVRALLDYQGKPVSEAGPAQPVEVLGISSVPDAGDQLIAVNDEQTARQVAGIRQTKQREQDMNKTARVNLDDLFAKIKEGEIKDLNIVLKADVQGSAEAVRGSLEKLSNEEVRIRVIHQGVGGVSETDVQLAAASNAIIIAFNVRPEPNARRAAEREGVDIRTYRIIYHAIDDIKAAMVGMLAPEFVEEVIGRAEVRQTFKVPNAGIIAGSYVIDGRIIRTASARVVRDNIVINEGKIGSLKRFKDDVREVSQGYECGIGLERFNDIKEGDILEAFVMKEVERKL